MMLKTFSIIRLVEWFLALGFLVSLNSCSGPGFAKSWQQAKRITSASGVEGAWEGHWKSDSNGHQGRLQCVIAAPTPPNQPHSFHYRATWMRILSGSYRAKHQMTDKGPDRWSFAGTHQMPTWAGGLYQYDGFIRKDTFTANYRCDIDQGTFTMKRVPTAANPSRNDQP